MRTPKADIDGVPLRAARKSLDLSVEEAARRSGVQPSKWTDWEAGRGQPTMAQLAKIAHALRKPLGYFFLAETPPEPEPLVRFRRFAPGHTLSPDLALDIRRAWERRAMVLAIVEDLAAASSHALLRIRPTPADEPEALAKSIRKALGVSVTDQLAAVETAAFALWRRAVEHAGVLVFETREIDVETARGFSLAERPLPVVVVNGKDALTARCFTLLHELVHVLLGEARLCDDGEQADVERFCDRVAAACLLPREAFRSEPLVAAHASGAAWSALTLGKLARRYRVSELSLLIRLVDLGLATKRDLTAHMPRLRLRKAAASTGAPPQHRLALKYAGRLFASLVLDAYARDVLTATEVSTYLGVRPKHIAAIEQEVALGTR